MSLNSDSTVSNNQLEKRVPCDLYTTLQTLNALPPIWGKKRNIAVFQKSGKSDISAVKTTQHFSPSETFWSDFSISVN